MVFGKSYSLVNSLRESIFREDLFLYNCLQLTADEFDEWPGDYNLTLTCRQPADRRRIS